MHAFLCQALLPPQDQTRERTNRQLQLSASMAEGGGIQICLRRGSDRLRLSMQDPTPPVDTPGIGGWDPVSKPGCLKAVKQLNWSLWVDKREPLTAAGVLIRDMAADNVLTTRQPRHGWFSLRCGANQVLSEVGFPSKEGCPL